MLPFVKKARRNPLRKWSVILWALLCLLIPFIANSYLALGPEITFAEPPAQRLVNPTHLSDGVKSYGYCSSVGGVAFGAIASGADGLMVTGLKYNNKLPDGQRLQVILSDRDNLQQTVTAEIYDWQLVPIARFAAREEHACFTLFGKLKDPQDEQNRLKRGEKILNYHPAFENTLLGFRLFQGDILILYPSSCDLPKEKGKYLLGAGETGPNVDDNYQALSAIHQLLNSLAGGPFQSYIICDYGVPVIFSIGNGGKLVLTGVPVWHCWKSSTKDPKSFQAIQTQANAEANRVLNDEYKKDAQKLTQAELDQKYTAAYQKELHYKTFDKIVSEALLVQMPDYSRALSAEILNQGGVNPAVYNSLATTLRYAALFRHFKQMNAAKYNAFVNSLNAVPIQPTVSTPTVLIFSK